MANQDLVVKTCLRISFRGLGAGFHLSQQKHVNFSVITRHIGAELARAHAEAAKDRIDDHEIALRRKRRQRSKSPKIGVEAAPSFPIVPAAKKARLPAE